MKKLAWIMALCVLVSGCGIKKPLVQPGQEKGNATQQKKSTTPDAQPIAPQPDNSNPDILPSQNVPQN
ncbi:MAG TPA: hypothetical protein VFT64_01185 [Rickettsiales bacterium]|nr:hypothetical protein [Rickettsiales bacterium]